MSIRATKYHGYLAVKCDTPPEDAVMRGIWPFRWNKKWACWLCGWGPVGLISLINGVHSLGRPILSEECHALIQAFERNPAIREQTPQHLVLPGIRTTPWGHQVRAFLLAENMPGFQLQMDMGTGKTLASLALMYIWSCGRTCERMLVVCPKSVVDVWPAEFDKHMLEEARSRFLVTPLNQRTVAAKVVAADRAEELAFHRGMIAVHIINYDAVWRPEMMRWLKGKELLATVMDECLPAGQRIATPDGDVPIEEVCIGDSVIGVDHNTGQIVTTCVTSTFRRETSERLVSIGGAEMTGNHPVFTQSGYVQASDILPGTLTVELSREQGLRMVWKPARCGAGQEKSSQEILQQVVLRQVAGENVPGDQGEVPHSGVQEALSGFDEQDAGASGCAGKAEEAPIWGDKSVQGFRTGIQGKVQGSSRGEGVGTPQGRKRSWSDRPSTIPIPRSGEGLEDGTRSQAKTSLELDNRHRPYREDDCYRGERGKPQLCCREGQGQEKARVPGVSGMDRDSNTQQGNTRESGTCTFTVYNIETGTGNYFANGLLVHNCHRIKSHNGRAARFMGDLLEQSERRIGMTGTPMPHSPMDIFAQYRAISKDVFGTVFGDFRARYAVMGGFENKQVVGYKNERDMNRRVEAISYRVKKSDVLTLPPTMHEVRSVELCASAKAIYKSMKRDLYALVGGSQSEIQAASQAVEMLRSAQSPVGRAVERAAGLPGGTGEVTAANALVKVLRLLQITSGVVELDDGTKQVVDDSKIKGFADLMEDMPAGDPVVIFSRFTRDIDLIRGTLAGLGRTCAVLDGRINQLSGWQRGEFDDIAIQIRAGGAGVDLTRAAYCVYYTQTHSLGDYDQSLARLDRPGQTRPVTYYHLVSKGTIDEQIYAALQNKRDVVEFILEGIKLVQDHERGQDNRALQGLAIQDALKMFGM